MNTDAEQQTRREREPTKKVTEEISSLQKWKLWFETIQAILTSLAILVAAIWALYILYQEREIFPHLNIKQAVSHIVLSDREDKENLLRVEINLENVGKRKLNIKDITIRIQQISPLIPCAEVTTCVGKEINIALENTVRKNDRFTWPLLAERIVSYDNSLVIEPGEIDKLDYEFVVPQEAKAIRVYTYLSNEKMSTDENEIGWKISKYYNFDEKSKEKVK